MKKGTKLKIFLIPGSIVFIGLIMYLYHFKDGLSTNSLVWGSFGAFMNPFVTLANVSLFVMFSLLVYNYNKSINSPILTFKTNDIDSREVWQITNIGHGPALNLLVAFKFGPDMEWESPAVKSYSLGKGDEVILDWLEGPVDLIGVYFKDLFDKEFIAIVSNDITEIISLSSVKSFEILGYKFEKSDFQKLLALESIRITRARKNKNIANKNYTTSSSTGKEATKL